MLYNIAHHEGGSSPVAGNRAPGSYYTPASSRLAALGTFLDGQGNGLWTKIS
jgi:hypothetical protein